LSAPAGPGFGPTIDHRVEFALLGLLALLWGSSYLFIRIAVAEIPPLTLIAARVSGATLVLGLVLLGQGQRLPRDGRMWRALGVQAFLNSIGAWTVLAWGQQFVDAGLASVLNSTSPIFVIALTAVFVRAAPVAPRKIVGAVLGFSGVVLIIGFEALQGLGASVAGQLACLTGALMYAGAALYGRRFGTLGAAVTATATMIWASAVLVPLAVIVDQPWTLTPGPRAILATLALSVLCTGLALVLYFRLLQTLGALGTASQAYLRAGVGLFLGVVFLGETLPVLALVGVGLALVGVVLIVGQRRAPAT